MGTEHKHTGTLCRTVKVIRTEKPTNGLESSGEHKLSRIQDIKMKFLVWSADGVVGDVTQTHTDTHSRYFTFETQ